MVNDKLEKLRKQNPEFDVMVETTQSKLDSFITKHTPKVERSFRVIYHSSNYTPRFFVKAVKLSTEERQEFLSFLDFSFLPKVAGDYFSIRKVPVLPLYYITTFNGVWI